MDYFNIFEKINNDKSFLIVEGSALKNVIKYKSDLEIKNKKIYKFKLISEHEFINLATFSIDPDLITDVNINNQNISIIEDYVRFSKYDFHNINKELVDFKNKNKKYIQINNHFINKINDYQFYHIGNPVYIEKIVTHYNLVYENLVMQKDIDSIDLSHIMTHSFLSKKEEVFFLFETISKLLIKGNNINNIYICNVDDSYLIDLKKASSFYNIPIALELEEALYDIPLVKKIFENEIEDIIMLLQDFNKLKEAYIDDYITDEIIFTETINKVINIFNNYKIVNNFTKRLYEVIVRDLKKTKNSKLTKKDSIKIINYEEISSLDKNALYFILGARYESFPKIAKNNDLLTDNEKDLINYPNSNDINVSTNNYLINLLNVLPPVYISFSEFDNYNEYEVSDIFSMIHQNKGITKIVFDDLVKGFSPLYYKTIFSSDELDSNYNKLLTTFKGDFNFNNEEKEVLKKHIENHEIKLTPSSITNYFRLPFVYYLERILKISTFTESVNLRIGNFFHIMTEVLIQIISDDISNVGNEFSSDNELNQKIIDYIINKEINDDFLLFFDEFFKLYFANIESSIEPLDIETLFFITKNKEIIVESLKFIDLIIKTNNPNLLLVEYKVDINNFTGKADLIIINHLNEYSIIDFKTSKKEAYSKDKLNELIIDLQNNKDYLSISYLELLQPLFYAFFLNEIHPEYKFSDIGFLTFITDKAPKLNSLLAHPKEGDLYTSPKKEARIISEEELNTIFSQIKKIINEVDEKILNGNFDINIIKDNKINNRIKLEDGWFSKYEALAFYNTNEVESEDDGDDE